MYLRQNLELDVSAVREALKVLDVLGMIDIRPGQGTYISGNEANFFSSFHFSWSLFMNGNQTESIFGSERSSGSESRLSGS